MLLPWTTNTLAKASSTRFKTPWLAGCLPDWQYLKTAGAEGWELVAATPAVQTEWQGIKVKMEYLYLKRELA